MKHLGCTIPLFPLFLAFLILKLTNTIDWSWWWVTCPLWIIPVIAIGCLAVIGAIFVAALVGKILG